jgi:hypothetical protein
VYNLSTVAGDPPLRGLVRVVLPMTEWWHRLLEDWTLDDIADKDLAALARAGDQGPRAPPVRSGPEAVKRRLRVRSDLLWMSAWWRPDDRAQRPAPPTAFTTREGVAAATEATG